MVQDTDLRIGNLVNEKELGICKVVCLFEICAWLNPLNPPEGKIRPVYSIQYKDIEPIELTEEWLLNLGFEKDNSSQYGGYLIAIGEGEKIRIVNDETQGWHWPMNGFCRPKAHFIHHLQNLFFALVGEELNIKP